MRKFSLQKAIIKNISLPIVLTLSISVINTITFAQNDKISTDPKLENTNINKPPLIPPIIKDGMETTSDGGKNQENIKNSNINVDAIMMYGQFNNIFTSFGLSQNLDSFTYHLNSDLKRSNDFDKHNNSSFYEGEIGFKGTADFTDKWKFIPFVEVKNESHGMFDNSFFTREEKDKFLFRLMNEYKPIPTRWTINVGGAQYVHRLNPVNVNSDDTTIDSKRSEFYKVNGEMGWEYISSASNGISFKTNFHYYAFSPSMVKDDSYSRSELTLGFKVIEYFKLELGGIINYNYDYDKKVWTLPRSFMPGGRVSLATSGFKYTTVSMGYSYDMLPFKPEELYFEHKFIGPNYNLPPGEVHKANMEAGVKIRLNGNKKVYAHSIEIKGKGAFEKNNNFYNYSPAPENLLIAESMSAESYVARADAILDFRIYKRKFKLGFNYIYSYYQADRNITYRPAYSASSMVKYEQKFFEVEWENSYKGAVYYNPDENDRIDSVVLGSVGLQFKMLETFRLYTKIDNIYNEKYSYRSGYPEPGITWIGGLRIII